MTRVARLCVAGALALLTLFAPGPAHADSTFVVPFTDPNAHGYLGFCDPNGNAITGGTQSIRPFIWTAVSTFAPPKQYLGQGQNSVINIYQVRENVNPGDWSGLSLTAASYWAIGKAPEAQATTIDPSLGDVMKAFPPMYDGLYQIRMYFGRARYGLYSTYYPATTIQVSGSTWKVVQGGTVSCKSLSPVVSNEVITGVSKTTPPKPGGYETRSASTGPIGALPTSARQASSAAASDSSTAASSVAPGGGAGAAGSSGGGSSAAWPIAASLAGVAALAVTGVALLRRRRRQANP